MAPLRDRVFDSDLGFRKALRDALAISFVGLINSAVSFGVQLVFPWDLANLGNVMTSMIYGGFAVVGLGIVVWLLPETKGKSLEEIERALVGKAA